MNVNTFLSNLESDGWIINREVINQANVKIEQDALNKIKGAPKEFLDFILSFTSCANKKDTIWFLSYRDYVNDEEIAFPWNEFENQSLESADSDEELLIDIKTYWASHIPFLMSVQDGYSYISICISQDNYGKIYMGREPEYEDSSCIAENLSVFFQSFFDIQW
jgi:hypothetical protein